MSTENPSQNEDSSSNSTQKLFEKKKNQNSIKKKKMDPNQLEKFRSFIENYLDQKGENGILLNSLPEILASFEPEFNYKEFDAKLKNFLVESIGDLVVILQSQPGNERICCSRFHPHVKALNLMKGEKRAEKMDKKEKKKEANASEKKEAKKKVNEKEERRGREKVERKVEEKREKREEKNEKREGKSERREEKRVTDKDRLDSLEAENALLIDTIKRLEARLVKKNIELEAAYSTIDLQREQLNTLLRSNISSPSKSKGKEPRKEPLNKSENLKSSKEEIVVNNTVTEERTVSSPSKPVVTVVSKPKISTPKDNSMKLLHVVDPKKFEEVIQFVAKRDGIPDHIAERDYYVTHAIWCLENAGFSVHLKGGVSLSKGYRLISRVSEDVDIFLLPGNGLPKSMKKTLKDLSDEDYLKDANKKEETILGTRHRSRCFKRMFSFLQEKLVGFKRVEAAGGKSPFFNNRWQHLAIILSYKSVCQEIGVLDSRLFPQQVVLEIGMHQPDHLKVMPWKPVWFKSRVMEATEGMEDVRDMGLVMNCPKRINCAHPAVTLLQKISDGILHRFPRPISEAVNQHYATGIGGRTPPFDPRIVRHYEDAARIIQFLEKGENSSANFPSIAPFKDFKELFLEMIKNSMVRRKQNPEEKEMQKDTSINPEGQEDQIVCEKFGLLNRCQDQRRALHFGEGSENVPSVTECSLIIRNWLNSVDL